MEKLLAALKQSGKRMTKARTAIAGIISRAESPLSADEVLKELAKRGAATDRTTCYRELAMLAREKFLDASVIDGVMRYEVAGEHHHHLVCDNCGKILEVELAHKLDDLEKALARSSGFKNITHALEFFGTCAACAN